MRWSEQTRKAASLLSSLQWFGFILKTQMKGSKDGIGPNMLRNLRGAEARFLFLKKKKKSLNDYRNCSRMQRGNKILQGQRDLVLKWDVYRTITHKYAALGLSIGLWCHLDLKMCRVQSITNVLSPTSVEAQLTSSRLFSCVCLGNQITVIFNVDRGWGLDLFCLKYGC